jgi:hypothetical protein
MHPKKQFILMMLLPGLFVLCLLSQRAEAQYGGGTGQADDPYLIYTPEQMNTIGANRKDWDKHFKLMANIDLRQYSGGDFKIIGMTNSSSFKGVFDGNHKKISMFSTTKRDYTGLFGYVRDSDAEIKNLGLINPNIEAETASNVGSLVSYLYEGTIANCYVKGGRVAGWKCVGGLVGYNKDGRIKGCHATCNVSGGEEVGGLAGHQRGEIDNCFATGRVSGNTYIGGLVGRAASGLITNSLAKGVVSGEGRYVGGFVGYHSGLISNCSAEGDVLGNENVGGLVGYNPGTIMCSFSSGTVSGQNDVGGLVGENREIIRDCYATGRISGIKHVGGLVGANTWPGKIDDSYSVGGVTGTTDVGGLVGFNDEGIVRASFWDSRTSGRSNMCGRQLYGIGCNDTNGKTTIEMKKANTFSAAGWDFVAESLNGTDDIWSICEGRDYPQFAWQFRAGDFDGDTRVDFADFAILAERWQDSDRPFFWCRGTDLMSDGKVDFHDLKAFTERWLAAGIGRLPDIEVIIIDDFESYNDLDPSDPESNRIFDTWVDGYNNPSVNGAVIGNLYPPFTERNIVHRGRQSMPYTYNTFFKFSRAECSLTPSQDWTGKGDGVLSLWFYGDESNFPSPMNIILNGGSVIYHDNAEAVQMEAWTEWTIDLQAVTGVDLTNVSSIAICFGDRNILQAGGQGKVFFDDIQLYQSK